jgi:hypothetical protein
MVVPIDFEVGFPEDNQIDDLKLNSIKVINMTTDIDIHKNIIKHTITTIVDSQQPNQTHLKMDIPFNNIHIKAQTCNNPIIK